MCVHLWLLLSLHYSVPIVVVGLLAVTCENATLHTRFTACVVSLKAKQPKYQWIKENLLVHCINVTLVAQISILLLVFLAIFVSSAVNTVTLVCSGLCVICTRCCIFSL